MNYCRTCKFWANNPHAIGIGNCTNFEALMRIFVQNGVFATAQNFGCVMHEEGYCGAQILTESAKHAIVKEFMEATLPEVSTNILKS